MIVNKKYFVSSSLSYCLAEWLLCLLLKNGTLALHNIVQVYNILMASLGVANNVIMNIKSINQILTLQNTTTLLTSSASWAMKYLKITTFIQKIGQGKRLTRQWNSWFWLFVGWLLFLAVHLHWLFLWQWLAVLAENEILVKTDSN